MPPRDADNNIEEPRSVNSFNGNFIIGFPGGVPSPEVPRVGPPAEKEPWFRKAVTTALCAIMVALVPLVWPVLVARAPVGEAPPINPPVSSVPESQVAPPVPGPQATPAPVETNSPEPQAPTTKKPPPVTSTTVPTTTSNGSITSSPETTSDTTPETPTTTTPTTIAPTSTGLPLGEVCSNVCAAPEHNDSSKAKNKPQTPND